jgi:hypothetical protein
MVRLHSGQFLWFVVAVVLFLGGCGGHRPPGGSPLPAKITLNPPTSASLQQGSILAFTASAQNGTGENVSPGFAFASDNPDVLTLSPAGLACAGTWNAPLYTICTGAGVGVANVTASALGATSPPTMVFVHAPIDNIQISVVPQLNSPPPACPTQVALPAACDITFNTGNCTTKVTPQGQSYLACTCLSQDQIQSLQANAFSQGTNITASVGPFTWSEATTGVVTVTPTVNLSTSIATNEASATPNTPGQTQVFASASGFSSQAYQFETCPIQCIALEVGTSDSQQAGETSFIVNEGTSETITATAVDVQGCVVPKPPLTWTSSQPASIVAGSAATGCPAGTTCTATTPAVGEAAITASCTPPTCNVGFPLNPAGLSPPFIPQPVYPVTAISGLVNPATSSNGTASASVFNVLATSLDCASNAFCTVALYNITTSKNVAGNAIQLPVPPNSLIFDPAGDKAYMGSEYGAALVNPANLGSGMSAFTTLPAAATPTGKVTGKALATSSNGNVAIFSDTVSTPNQVYVVNTTSAAGTTTLNISEATTAAFSPDGLKAFIIGCVTGPVPCTAVSGNTLYIYSTLQSLQSIALSFPANAVVFSSSGSFALVSGGSSTAASAITVNTCDNSSNSLSLGSLPGPPTFLKMVPAGNVLLTQIPSLTTVGLDFFFGLDATGVDIIATNASQPPLQGPLAALCPQSVGLATLKQNPTQTFSPVHIPFGQGSFNPINFFLSPDNAQVYVVASDLSRVLVYSFNTSSVSAIPLANSITGQTVFPVSADITPDGNLIYVAASDGTLHEISTASGDSADLTQIPFPPIPNATNGFCVSADSPVNCTLNLVVVRP